MRATEKQAIANEGRNGSIAEGRPEVWLALQGFLVAFLWEMLQMPFYEMIGMTAWEVTRSCALASLGDAGIMVLAAWIADRTTGNLLWAERLSPRPLGIYLAVGLGVTVVIEWWALRSAWGWQYGDTMPTIFGIGLVPIGMWVVVPVISLYFAKKLASAR